MHNPNQRFPGLLGANITIIHYKKVHATSTFAGNWEQF
jgi:hypothetical protein